MTTIEGSCSPASVNLREEFEHFRQGLGSPHRNLQLHTWSEKGTWCIRIRASYVVELRPDECDVVVGSAEEALIWTVRVDGLVQHVDELPEHGYTQLRSTGGAVGVRIEKDGEEMLLHLEEAVRGVAPGQAAVVYVDDVVVAAGAISSVSG